MKTKQNSEPAIQSSAAGRRRVIIIAAAIVAAVLAVAIGIIVRSSNPVRHLRTQLDLGDRYLSELDYEQAVAAYEMALQIDSKSTDAYSGLIIAHGQQENFDTVAGIYIMATGKLDEPELMQVVAVLEHEVSEYVNTLLREGREEEALRILERMRAAIGSDVLHEPLQLVKQAIANKVLVWERPLYQMIVSGGYLQSGEYYFVGIVENGLEAEPICFALRDLNVLSDGVPEVSIYNGSPVYLGSSNYIYSLQNREYKCIGGLKGCDVDGHRISDEAAYPGIFDEGAHTGGYWTSYCYIDINGVYQVDEVLTGDATGDELKEVWRTENDALYAAYQRIGGWDWGGENGRPNELKYFTLEEINSMGWEAFLEAYGYTSFLFTEYSSGSDPAEGGAKTEDVEEGVHEIAVDSLPEKLPEFLSNFGWYSAAYGEGARQASNYDHTNPKDLFFFYQSFFSLDNRLYAPKLFPGIVKNIQKGDDPQNRFRGDALIFDAENVGWVLKNVYNWKDEQVFSSQTTEDYEFFYYVDGKYYAAQRGAGDGYEADIKRAFFDGNHYYVEYDLIRPYWMGSETHYAEMEHKSINGLGYWSIYRDSLQPSDAFELYTADKTSNAIEANEPGIVEELVLSKELQQALNIFLCNFTEANVVPYGIGFYQYDREDFDITQIMDFAFIWTWINQPHNMNDYPEPNLQHYGITLKQINYVLDRYFGYTISENEARGYDNNDEYSYYQDGILHLRYQEGVAPFETESAIVDRASRLSDGTILLEFTVYLIDYGEEKEYYPLSPAEAARRNGSNQYRLNRRYHGTAIAKPYEENGKTRYKLLKYTTDQQ